MKLFFHKGIYKTVGAVCLSLTLLQLPSAAYADAPAGAVGPVASGPSQSTYTRKQEVGPGMQEENYGDTSLLPTIQVSNDFLDKKIEDPIVRPADKYSFTQMEADIRSLKQRYGERLQVSQIGTSRDGRAIYELVIGNPNAPKHVLFQGAIHGRESMVPLLMMTQAEMALANYDSGHYNGRALSETFAQVALHMVPMINPDGVTISQFGLESLWNEATRQAVIDSYTSDTALERTSRSLEEYLMYWKANGFGTDLNQNYPAYWESLAATATGPSYAGYKGTAPLSEPENQALAALTESRSWAATISYHSMGNIIYWDTVNNQVSEASRELAQMISSVSGYRLDHSLGKGGYKDWVQTKTNPIPSVTVEVGSVPCPMPLSEFPAVWEQNQSVWVHVIDQIARQ